jgi:hypothetical protein
MSADQDRRTGRKELLLAGAIVAVGLVISGLSLTQLMAGGREMAQATQPLQSAPPSTTTGQAPAEAKPGGERPTTPAPEPAHPNDQAQKEGVKPALPDAPAEKMAAPVQQK